MALSEVTSVNLGQPDVTSVAIPTAGPPLGWFTADRVARRFGITEAAISLKIRLGELKGQRFGRTYAIPPDEMSRILADLVEMDPPATAAEAIGSLEAALQASREEARVLVAANRELHHMVRDLRVLLPADEDEALAAGITYRHDDGRWSARVRCPDGEVRTFYTKSDLPTPFRRDPMPLGLRFEILARDGFRCRYCGRDADEVRLHVDHVIPVVRGGTDDPANLVTACQDCNLGKSDTELPTPPHPGSDREGDME